MNGWLANFYLDDYAEPASTIDLRCHAQYGATPAYNFIRTYVAFCS